MPCIGRRQWRLTPILLPGKISWTEEPGRLQSMGSLSRTRLRDFTFTFHFQALEKEMATHSSVLAWRIPEMGEPGGLLSMGSHRVGYDWSNLAAAAMPCIKSVISLKKMLPIAWLIILNEITNREWVKFSKGRLWKNVWNLPYLHLNIILSSIHCVLEKYLFSEQIIEMREEKNTILSLNSTNISGKSFETSLEQVKYGEQKLQF